MKIELFNIGGKVKALARKFSSMPTARDYVQNGLIAMWDGIENAGWDVHNDSATVWTDLIGGDLWNLTEHGSFGKSFFVSDGLGVSADGATFAKYKHIEVVLSSDNDSSTGTILHTSYTGYTNPTQVVKGSASSYNAGYTMGLPVEDITKINNISFPYVARASFYGYVNGTSAVRMSSGYYDSAGTGVPKIGSRADGTRAWAGRIYAIRLYDRILGDDDVAANWKIDKARFKLPD